jgi:hypothetical protein
VLVTAPSAALVDHTDGLLNAKRNKEIL